MATEPLTRLRWHGKESINIARDLAEHGHGFVIELPADVHHALFAHLHPDAEPGAEERVETRGGQELLSQVAEIGGLAPVAGLVSCVADKGVQVAVVSPAPRLIVEFPS